MGAELVMIVKFLGLLREYAPEAVTLVDEIAGFLKDKHPEHADRVDQILGARGATADAVDEIAAEIKASGG